MDGSDADGDFVLIQTFLLYYVNQVILISGQRDSPALVDFAIGHVNFVLNLPYWQALFFGKIQTTEGL